MCLANVYREKNSPETLVCEYVSKLKLDKNGVMLTDIMNNNIFVEGTLSMIDLESNTIIIEPTSQNN